MNSTDELLHYLHGGWPSTKKHTALRSKIEKVRIDALLEASEIADGVRSACAEDTWKFPRQAIRDAILARAKEVDGK